MITVTARAFVLATGGLENPRLLLLSNDVQSEGLGNAHDQVGRYFMEHLLLSTGLFIVSDPNAQFSLYGDPQDIGGIDVQLTLSFDRDFLVQQELPNLYFELQSQRGYGFADAVSSARHIGGALTDLSWPASFGDHLANVVQGMDVLIDAGSTAAFGGPVFYDQPPLAFRVYAYGEQIPNPESRVTLGDDRDRLGQRRCELSWQTTAIDHQGIRRGVEALAREVGRTGTGRFQVSGNLDSPDLQGLSGGHHHMGTTRMSDDPRTGVVDGNCRVHNIDNLYIAGSSVFSTSGFANPTLTIVALALRLADHLNMQHP